ncbi:MAG TPA: tetratricopeptide repeat protein [Candidatus Acidoferrales bacterium]|nr:tetratricopeptide repeat protein [Candidatus Acidoferrales bacterium]
MAHISRKELKKDEFRETLAHGAEAISSHKETLWQVTVVVLVVVCAVLGWRLYWNRLNSRASAALAEAMKIYDAPVTANGDQPVPGEPVYHQEQEKYAAAQQALGAVAIRFKHAHAGQMAGYYAAVSLEHLGRYQDAANRLAPMVKGGDTQLQALARFELAQVNDAMGKPDQAVALYQELLNQPSVFVPKPEVLFALGDHYRASNPQQAAKYYQEVKSEYPNTGLADQADQRLQMLGKT